MTGRGGNIEEGGPVAGDSEEDGEAMETHELELDDDERLPWLESADDEEDGQGVDAGRVVGFALLALLALAVLLGGGWYLLRETGDRDFVADGSTIEAPEGPYKERPEEPGGRVARGTGDIAPAVGEGQSREGRLAQDQDVPSPSAPATGDDGDEEASTGVAVQVGAFSNRETAQRGWATLTRQTEALSGVKHRIVEGRADIGTVYRLQALAVDVAAARRLCDALQADGVACQVKR
ncbi:SPOR domain-containing protein [Pelagerythrobacter rhizovicinus]|uniref:SPOR domain-containing protein n=1 Tax=Pelagerythrobacter rhizovicinus TaxID=2268576 RepID=A0A4Q2KGB0_9SPHN|nr:SPOR domain-containing protein [Pelagerythrobacter rhizovicinus]RXZ64075.1 SPOR domain-containing protein [Pelagerythrobacter rhizovicinus]